MYSLLIIIILGNTFQNIFPQENTVLSNSNTNLVNPLQTDDSKSISIDPNKTDNKDNKNIDTPKSERVIVQTNIELVEDDSCECAFVALQSNGFPFYSLFAIGGATLIPVAVNSFDEEPPPGPDNVVSPSTP